MRKYNRYKKQYQKDQQTIKSVVNLFLVERNDYELNEYECYTFTKCLDETKKESFLIILNESTYTVSFF